MFNEMTIAQASVHSENEELISANVSVLQVELFI